MATGNIGRQSRTTQQQNQLLQEQQRTERALEEQRSLEGFDQDQDLDSTQAASLQTHVGNEAVQELIDRLRNINNALDDFALEEEQIQEQDEEFNMEEELQGQSFGGGGANAAGSGTAGNPWELEFFHGGDDDDNPIKRKKRRRKKRGFQETYNPDDDHDRPLPTAKPIQQIDAFLPRPKQGKRNGDARYKAVEDALQDPRFLYGQSLDPSDLAKRQGVADPIRGPVEIGRFLGQYAQSNLARSLGSMLGGPMAPLVTPQGGFSTAVARLATMAVCAEAAEGQGALTDRAVALSLRRETWTQAVGLAKQLAQQGQLHAPKICATAFDENIPESSQPLPSPSILGGAALTHILPPPIAVPPPYLAIEAEPEPAESDLLAMIDSTLAQWTGGKDPAAYEPPRIDQQTLFPALKCANRLLNSLGRAQVEFAAAAIAVRNISPHAALYSTLTHADTAMRQLARSTVKAGKALERLQGQLYEDVEPRVSQFLFMLRETNKALLSLRTWGFSTLAGSMDQEPNHEST